jgi:hypothetical protein
MRAAACQRLVRSFGNFSLALCAALTLAACGGGGGGGGADNTPPPAPPAPPPPNSAINATTSYRYQNTPAPADIGTLLAANAISGHYFDARQYVDLDGDGVNEIVVAPGQHPEAFYPVRIYKRQTNGTYADVTATLLAAVPGQVHPRKVIAQDFNGDGRLDLYFVDHGFDQNPFPGAQNVLMLSNLTTGKLEQKAIPSNPTAFHHCASAGDINNNATVDIFVCADAWQGAQKAPYLLLNDGAGNMTLTRIGVPASLLGGTAAIGMLAAELTDIDGDGFLDLVAGYRSESGSPIVTTFSTAIFWGDGTGTFSDARAITLPNPSSFVATYDVKVEDIDGDGRRDVVLLRVTAALDGYYLQILRQTSARVFADESLTRIIGNAQTWEGNSASWFPWLHMADIEGNGSLDILIGDQSGQIPARDLRWANDGAGVFSKLH